MKLKKIRFSTRLSDLYGRDDYQSHIEVGREYWYLFSRTDKIHEGWHKIKVTYIRRGCMFYTIEDVPEVGEEFCPVSCFMTAMFEYAEIDPIKDMGDKLGDIDVAKNTCCFDTERTIVKNWPNEDEIDEEELDSLSKLMLMAIVKEE